MAAAVAGLALALWPSAAFAEDASDLPDGGELSDEALAEALREGTPEEIELRRLDLMARLDQAGTVEKFVSELEAEATAALDIVDADLRESQQELAAARVAADVANEQRAAANAERKRAVERAEQADADLREAAVDMFINPPQGNSLQAALSGTVDDEMMSSGLLLERAEARRQIFQRRDRARAAASKAVSDAERATQDAQAAIVREENAGVRIAAQLAERTEELERIRAELELARQEVVDLELTDSVLEARLALGAVTTSGQVTASLDSQGNWVPRTTGLPSEADMVRIGSTSVWVHRVAAPQTEAMFQAALRDGVVLGGGAYRDTLRQIELRASHCGTSYEAIFEAPSSSCSPPTARPGQSMHERGLAIDFSEGDSALGRSSEAFAWLSAHAAEYGYFNLPSEPWHWSVNGR